ncbi:MAG: ABC transporter ATP-binding protein [Candidatus Pacebacteria bacterium]|nr:ABC transporter ATP-binding protein [Candidatus Paceibacterota bacterium]
MKKKQIAIELKNITKRYVLHHEKPTFSEQMIRRSKKEEFVALDDVSLTIYKGESVGIIGPNGAGKTTLLKVIAGIATPTSGTVSVYGRVVSLIDLEAGFNPELTGEENIYLNGLVIGMRRKEIEKVFKKIVAFADIGNFIDAPLYTYSQGMKLRLGFSVAVHANPDILILDEGMAVGDEEFRGKSGERIRQFFKEGKTVLMVSHWLEFLEKYAKRIALVEGGKLIEVGGLVILKEYVREKN